MLRKWKERLVRAETWLGRKFSLRIRLTLMVTAELVVCIGAAVGLDRLFRLFFSKAWGIPLIAELLIVSLMIGGLLTNVLARVFFHPIKELGKAMEKVAEGDFSIRLNPNVNAMEIREIYSGFNLMTRELSATEILQTDFMSNVSHEFKTPLNAIEGYTTLLQGCENLSEEQRQYVEKILFNTKRLSDLAGSTLLLAKIENQTIPTNRSRFCLDEQIRQSVVSLEPVWAKKDIEFDVELEDAVEYYGCEALLHHVWDNLIGNAVKFDPQGGLVRLRLFRREGQIVFTVEDSGSGIEPEAAKHIFDKFYQADSSHFDEGNGLGLALVKKILSLENGSIAVRNRAEGGCIFTVILQDSTILEL